MNKTERKKARIKKHVLPDKMKSGNQTYDTLKKRLKKYFTEKFISQVDRPQYSRKCWSRKLRSGNEVEFATRHAGLFC